MKKERLNKNFLDEFQEYNFSIIKETKIFLVGSIRFKEYFIKLESILQIMYKKLVGICSVDGLLNKDKFSEEEWDKLQEIALMKLNEQEAILVIDVDNYIGVQSREEIEYFKFTLHKPVYYLSGLKND
ncbi:MAG: hypothetical protein HWN80_12460 [Candidatus Lokiarchaeota archaeon]|nr:hypothetical protein [Candidatus Lokiarchaeota archaeon]